MPHFRLLQCDSCRHVSKVACMTWEFTQHAARLQDAAITHLHGDLPRYSGAVHLVDGAGVGRRGDAVNAARVIEGRAALGEGNGRGAVERESKN
jgi:hypothetical protein